MKFHSLQDVADVLGVHIATVRRLVKAGDLVAVRVGRSLRVTDDDLARFVEGNRHAGSGDAR